MKKKSYLFFIGVGFSLLLIWLIPRIYFICKYDGDNLVLILCPELPLSEDTNLDVKIEILLDDKIIYYSDSIKVAYEDIGEKVSLKKHTIKVRINSIEVEEASFFVFPIKWVIIEYKSEENVSISTTNYRPLLM